MKRILKLLKNHVLTIIGSLLILISIYLIGICGFHLETNLSEKQQSLNDVEEGIYEANYAHNKSNINYNFAHLLRTVIKVSFIQDLTIQNAYEKAYRASIFPMLIRLYEASGDILNNKQLNELKTKCDLAVDGNDILMNELLETSVVLLEKSGIHRGDLIVKKAVITNSIGVVQKDIIATKNWAIISQILGLLFLLFRDIRKENV